MTSAIIIFIAILTLLSLNLYATALWHWSIRPLVKKYCGGKSNSYGLTNVGMLLDYFMACKIIKNEGLKPMWQIKLYGMTMLLDLIVPLGIGGFIMISK